MTYQEIIRKLQSRIDKRANAIAELEEEIGLSKTVLSLGSTRAAFWADMLKSERETLKLLVADQKLDKNALSAINDLLTLSDRWATYVAMQEDAWK